MFFILTFAVIFMAIVCILSRSIKVSDIPLQKPQTFCVHRTQSLNTFCVQPNFFCVIYTGICVNATTVIAYSDWLLLTERCAVIGCLLIERKSWDQGRQFHNRVAKIVLFSWQITETGFKDHVFIEECQSNRFT